MKYILASLFFLITYSNALASECLEFHVIENKPQGYQYSTSHTKGVHWEYIEAIESESGLCIKKTLTPYARIWRSLEEGNHDGGIIFSSPDRADIVRLIAPIREIKTVVVAKKSQQLEHYDDLYRLSIGKVRGSRLNDQFDNDDELNIVNLTHYSQATKMLSKDRIDAMAGGAQMIAYQLHTNNMNSLLDSGNRLVLGSRTQWLQMSQKSQHLDKADELAAAINRLVENGTFDDIMEKYYGPNWREFNQ